MPFSLSIHMCSINTKQGKGKGKLLPKIEEITIGKAHIHTHGNLIEIFLQTQRLSLSEESECM